MFPCNDCDIQSLCNILENASPRLPIELIESLRIGSNAAFLDTLSQLALDSRFSHHILVRYSPVFVDVVARWPRFFSFHQIAAGLARLLPVAEHLFPFAERYILSQSQIFTFGISQNQRDDIGAIRNTIVSLSNNDLLDICVTLYRLLSYRPLVFMPLVDSRIWWALVEHESAPVRYLAIRILGMYIGAAEIWVEDMIRKHVGGDGITAEFEGEVIDFYFLPLHERQRLGQIAQELRDIATRELSDGQNPVTRVITKEDLSPLSADIAGILLPKLNGSPSTTSSLVDTTTTNANLHNFAQALLQNDPILLSGPAGSGKTSIVHHVAHTLNTLKTLVSIHLGDQTDAKLLIGAYNTTDKPGVFEWRPGVLTRAVKEGRWVLIEDIDKAPADVLSVILPLLEKGELKLANRGEIVRPGSGFRLLATLKTIPGRDGSDPVHRNILGSRLWRKVDVSMPGSGELEKIVTTRFPLLSRLSKTIMNIFAAVQKLYLDPSFFLVSKTSMERRLSPRDLMRWCTRVNAFLQAANVTESTISYPESLYDQIFLESVDCFAGNLQTMDARILVTDAIATEMQFPPQRVKYYLESYTPLYSQTESHINVGRVKLKRKTESASQKRLRDMGNQRPFATTNHAALLLEQIGAGVGLGEPVLLVGETGTGKTSIVQQLAHLMRTKLTVVNLSQQTESGDLIGGYKPVDERGLIYSLKEQFDVLFESTFAVKKNARFLAVLGKAVAQQQWNRVIILWKEAVKMSEAVLAKASEPENTAFNLDEPLASPKKKRKVELFDKQELKAKWNAFARELENLERQNAQAAKAFAFSFIEGPLVKCARNGDWILLDEINLAAPATLEAIADLLQEQGNRSILLSEKGQVERVHAHPDFRIFACMNPATDVGKKDLPPGIRSRFTELYVTNPDRDIANLLSIIKEYLGDLCIREPKAPMDIAQLYLEAKQLAEQHKLVDGANQRPHFSIRTLARTLSYVVEICHVYGLRRSLYEGFCMNFLTQLDQTSENILFPIIMNYILGSHSNARSMISQTPRRPAGDYVQFRHYWMHQGEHPIVEQQHYILTPFVERNMLNLVRATATRKFPVLIQGPTSSGKTSMIEYLAKKTGHKFVRINNHEHTDLQEYLGSYVSDMEGKLHFQEGVLVEALRKGYWIVLDELNLAPTDVLESLNRLLDDNRELLVPETQEVIRPHKDFMLFATQNPPGLYGGRKQLSRAFRNRFLELHFDDIPEDELREILEKRTQIAPPYCVKIVEVYKELSILRQSSRLFEQKHSFATLRDLFRWAGREAIGYDALARNGYMLLAEKVRKPDEKEAVKKVIEKVMRVKIDEEKVYNDVSAISPELAANTSNLQTSVVWTKAMRRLYYLVASALQNNEPVLLVGETGCGKTTVCQMLASACAKQLYVVNAHMNTETGDIIGAQRPIRSRGQATAQLFEDLSSLFHQAVQQNGSAAPDLGYLIKWFDLLSEETKQQLSPEMYARIRENRKKMKALFEWCDGSLIQAMREGQFFLLDEISLADDSVLERLNSVLEPERSILLAEKGPNESFVVGAEGFQFMATMNPGGDYGKRELSPALRNRFTEIWVPPMTDMDDVVQIVQSSLKPIAQQVSRIIVEFTAWFGRTYNLSATHTMSIRDVLSWVNFVNTVVEDQGLQVALLQGAAMVFIDGLGANPSAILTISTDSLVEEKKKCVQHLSTLVGEDLMPMYLEKSVINVHDNGLSIGSYHLQRKAATLGNPNFNLWAPTTSMNAMRILRALRLNKPILLEGNPGVGKTSLVSALAKLSGNPLTRINLSEQTDLMDLFGSDVPKEGGKSGEFEWRDAPFLRAMQLGHWVLLDEMNLASQAVLEGLNACLDHRGEAYVSELDKTFKRHPEFMVFAAQNPHHQGGGRKGLPASFVNRFTVVHVDILSKEDLLMISCQLFPKLDVQVIQNVVDFIALLEQEVVHRRSFGRVGAPWEFNLRDILRWFELLASEGNLHTHNDPSQFLDLIVKQRFRSIGDKHVVDRLYSQVFSSMPKSRQMYHSISREWFQVGHALLQRSPSAASLDLHGVSLLNHQLPVLETIMTSHQFAWPSILVGPSGCGKTSVIKLLAAVVGAEVDEFALNADVDTIDIVGGFEQADPVRRFRRVVENIRSYVKNQLIHTDSSEKKPIEVYLNILRSTETSQENMQEVFAVLFELTNRLPASGTLLSLMADLQRVVEIAKETDVRFEWFDGTIVRAAEEGRWLVLDNANLCSPSVLDRLNSLLENEGFLAINEHGDVNGDARIVRPHPNFRLFLTMDPRHGELSRAMRNRGVEIFMEPDSSLQMHEQRFDRDVITTSTMANFKTVDEVVRNSKDRDDAERVLQISLDYLPACEIDNLARWLNRHDSIMSVFSESVVGKYTYLRSHKLAAMLQGEIEAMCTHTNISRSFALSQPINALMNPYLLQKFAAIDEEHRSFTLWMLKSFRLLQSTWEMQRFEYDLSQCSTRTENPDMTYLERSVARSAPSAYRAERKTESTVVEFLGTSREWIASYLENMRHSDNNMTLLSIIASLEKLYWDLVSLSNSKEMDDSVLQVFLVFMRAWLADSSSILPNIAYDRLSQVIDKFTGQLELTSGFSMERIWNTRRPIVPSSAHVLELYGSLLKFAERFDDVATKYKGALTDILTVKSAFLNALSLIKRNSMPAAGILSEMGQTIDQLEAYAGEERNVFFFKEQFDAVLKYRQLQSGSPDSSRDMHFLTLSHYSGLPVRGIVCAYTAGEESKPVCEPFLRSIWREEEGIESGISRLLTGELGLSNLAADVTVHEAGIGSMAALRVELSSLSQQFALNIGNVVDDMLLKLSNTLVEELRNLFRIHADAYSSSTYGEIDRLLSSLVSESPHKNSEALDLQSLDEFVSQTADAKFSRIVTQFLQKSIAHVASSYSGDLSQRSKDLGVAWPLYSVAALSLYVPNYAFDPAMKPRVLKKRYLLQKGRINSEIVSQQHVEKLFTGGEDNMAIETLRKELVELGDEPEGSNVVRPEVSEMNSLQGEFVNILSLLRSQPQEHLLNALLSGGGVNEENMFQTNLSRVIERLENGYHYYTDITELAVGFLYSLKLGIRLAKHSQDVVQRESLPDHILGTGSRLFHTQSDEQILAYVAGCESADTLLHFLWSIASRARIESSGAFTNGRTLDIILRRFLQVWKQKTEQEREDAAAKSSIYRYKGLEEQEDDEQEMRAMFPVSEDEEGQLPIDEVEDKKISLSENMGAKVAQFYVSYFLKESDSQTNVESILLRSSKLAQKLNVKEFIVQPPELETLIPLNILTLRESADWLNGVQRNENPESFDFYKDENVAEAAELVRIVNAARIRLSKLIDAWPENEILRDAWTVTTEILKFPISCPVAKFITKVEKLHGVLHEWQTVANREFSAAEHYDELTKLIIRWRRLELSTWPRLLTAEEENCRTESYGWWFYGYESAVANSLNLLADGQDLVGHVVQLVSIFSAFIASATVGQFAPRIKLLNAFKSHASSLMERYPPMEAVTTAIANVITYYSQFDEQIQSSLQQHRIKLEKDVKEIILLASWKDSNITALRESAKRSHHKLYKVVKKFRLILSQPVSVALCNGLQEMKSPASTTDEVAPNVVYEYSLDSVNENKSKCSTQFERWSERPKRLLDISSTVGIMIKTREAAKFQASEVLSDFTSNITTTIKELRSETPSVLTEDNQELVKRLKARKQKAVTDTLKDLRRMGLRSNLGGDTLEKQSSLEKLLATTPELSDMSNIPLHGNDYFFRILELLPKVRMAASQHSPDISSVDIVRGSGYFEHILSISLTHRSKLSSSLKQLQGLEGCIENYRVLGFDTQEIYPKNTDNQVAYDATGRSLKWLPNILDLARSLVETQAKFAQTTVPSGLSSLLGTWKEKCVELCARFDAQQSRAKVVTTSDLKSVVQDAHSYILALREEMVTLRTNYPDFRYISHLIEPWISSHGQISISSIKSGAVEGSEQVFLNELDSSLQKLCNSILVTLQHLREAHSLASQDETEKGWLTKQQTSQLAVLKALHISDVSSQLASLLENLGRFAHLTNNATAIRAIFIFSFPIIAEYMNTCRLAVSDAVTFYGAVCKLGHVISTSMVTLANNGFCMPAEKDEAKGKENASGVEEGTGLGDGEGVEDVSSDLDDEDMNNLAEQEQKEEEDRDKAEKEEVEAEDNAMEMDDMEGKMEDVKQDEDEKDNDAKEGEEEDALDEESGDVDELDPGAVDEKFWDEEGKEDDKEKEGGEGIDGKQSEDMEAKQEEDKKKEEKDKKGEKEKGEVEEDDNASDEEGEGAEENDEVAPKDDNETADQHMPEVDTLELPEDLNLDDGDDASGGEGENDLDEDMDDLPEEDFNKLPEEEKDQSKVDEKGDEEEEQNPEEEPEAEEGEGDAKEEVADETNEEESPEQDNINPEEPEDKAGENARDDETMEAQDAAPSDVQGQDGQDKDDDAVGASNAESGEQKEGAEGASGTGEEGSFEQARREPTNSENKEKDTREAAMEQLFRKLGDPLQKFYRQNKEILNASDDTNDDQEQVAEDQMDVDNTEFEHLQNENDKEDTQALGAATAEQSKALDDSMAIDPDEKAPNDMLEDDMMPDEDEVVENPNENVDVITAEDLHKLTDDSIPETEKDKHAGAVIGKTTRAQDSSEDSIMKGQASLSDDEEEEEEDPNITPEMNHLSLSSNTAPVCRSYTEARSLWQHYESSTRTLSLGLTEQLRLILEPTLNTKMRGDFRTGKRLNMKRIIPYIASDYKKDKIWMRRSKPSKRSYQVMIALDDSKSMSENPRTTSLAFETVALIAKALSQLEVGEIAIASFGEDTKLVHSFDQPFTSDAGVDVFARLGFTQTKTNVKRLLESSLSVFEAARSTASSSKGDLWQLQIIVSDGICEDHSTIRQLLRSAHEKKIMVVFVVVDAIRGTSTSAAAGGTQYSSILDMKEVVFEPSGTGSNMKIRRYMDSFPFGYYLLVRQVDELPAVLATALRQWLAEIVDATVG